MKSLQRNRTTAEQATQLEDGALNLLRHGTPLYSPEYRRLLQNRRQLPVSHYRQQFLEAYHKSQILVLTSDTGGGKTTQIPQFVLFDEYASKKRVACTQPRRLAASSVATRVAAEMDVTLGQEVGYTVRFDEETTQATTRIEYMTDGHLLQASLSDRRLSKYSCVIIDEAHERTVATDILMAVLKRIARSREDLKIIIMSATLDGPKFQAYFDNAAHFHIPGRQYPVDVYHLERNTKSYFDTCIDYVRDIHYNMPEGDILVFLTGEEEIEKACTIIRKEMKRSIEVLPLYSALPFSRQQRVFEAAQRRKCVITTNIAEASLTIDGIAYVVDSGLVKEMVFNPRARLEILMTKTITKASANQRLGRAGRTRPGKCFRMYTKKVYEEIFPESLKPSILREETKSTILQLNSIGVKDVLAFDLIDPPDPELYLSGMEDLFHL